MFHSNNLRRKLPSVLWNALLSALLIYGILAVLIALWGSLTPGLTLPLLAALAGWVLCRAAEAAKRRPALGWTLRLLPWAVLIAVLGPGEIWQGLLLWFNCIIAIWNRLHESAIALFAAAATERSVRALSLLFGFAAGQLAHWLVFRRRTIFCGALTVLLLLLQLLAATLAPLPSALCILTLLGLWVTAERSAPIRQAFTLWVLAAAALLLCVCFAPRDELAGVTALRSGAAQELHTLRYGHDLLPEGHLDRAALLNEGESEVMSVRTEQEKNLYLRAFVGSVYSDGVWTPLPDSAYGGDYAGMLTWLSEQGFDPLTQPAAYYALCGEEDAPEENHVAVDVADAARCYIYLPASAAGVMDAAVTEKQDARFAPRGLFGARSYAASEFSPSRPAELTVRAQWVAQPDTAERLQYTRAEAVYREFVYQSYTQTDPELEPLIRQIFWEDEEQESGGIYSALTHVREVLRHRTFYTETPEALPEGTEPLRDFLAGSRRGNAALYATAAVEALRARGIPARYVEGYYLSAAAAARSGPGAVSLSGRNAHAWAEVYFDGIGWLPVDATPGYYYDAVTLQQMVSLPDTVRKTAVMDDSGTSGTLAENGTTGTKPQPGPIVVLRDTLLVLGGAAVLVVVLLTLAFLILELLRLLAEQRAAARLRRAGPAAKARLLRHRLFHLLNLWGIDACLGWNTDRTDAALAGRFPDTAPGDYRRAAALMEKSVYGGMELEPYELRAIESLLGKIAAARPARRSQRIRLRYSRLIPEKNA